ncbi:hypothetical protein B5X24_HaOG215071, partial [Helicoverpa armigera]
SLHLAAGARPARRRRANGAPTARGQRVVGALAASRSLNSMRRRAAAVLLPCCYNVAQA